jgi:aminomethyltransferase
VRDAAKGFDCAVEDLSDRYTQIAIQGPNGWRTLQKLTDADLSSVKFYWFTHGSVCGLSNTLIARTGYTAEDGFEIYIPSDETTSICVWKQLLGAGEEFGILPCGLGARNTLRLEGALSLYGHEISDTITPWEARLDRFLKMEKGEFIGHSVLASQKQRGLKNILVGLEAIERGIPRDGYTVTHPKGHRIGYVTSGSPAPFLKKNIALAYVPLEHSAEGTELGVECRNLNVKCKVVPTPFYKRPRPTKPQ